jgi:hypothetical protein
MRLPSSLGKWTPTVSAILQNKTKNYWSVYSMANVRLPNRNMVDVTIYLLKKDLNMKIDWEDLTIAAIAITMVTAWILGVSWGYF